MRNHTILARPQIAEMKLPFLPSETHLFVLKEQIHADQIAGLGRHSFVATGPIHGIERNNRARKPCLSDLNPINPRQNFAALLGYSMHFNLLNNLNFIWIALGQLGVNPRHGGASIKKSFDGRSNNFYFNKRADVALKGK